MEKRRSFPALRWGWGRGAGGSYPWAGGFSGSAPSCEQRGPRVLRAPPRQTPPDWDWHLQHSGGPWLGQASSPAHL